MIDKTKGQVRGYSGRSIAKDYTVIIFPGAGFEFLERYRVPRVLVLGIFKREWTWG
jgi:hypothetical protein